MGCGCGGGGAKAKQVNFNQNGNAKVNTPLTAAPPPSKIVSGVNNISPVFGTALPTPQLGTEQDAKRIQKLRQLAIRQTFNRG